MGSGSRRKEPALSEPGSVQSASVSSSLKPVAGIIYFQSPMSPQGNVPTRASCVECWSQLILVLTPPPSSVQGLHVGSSKSVSGGRLGGSIYIQKWANATNQSSSPAPTPCPSRAKVPGQHQLSFP